MHIILYKEFLFDTLLLSIQPLYQMVYHKLAIEVCLVAVALIFKIFGFFVATPSSLISFFIYNEYTINGSWLVKHLFTSFSYQRLEVSRPH